MRRALLPLVALAAGCARDLDLPTSSPPRIDAVAVVGLEAQAVSSNLPVLGGELLAIRGGGFPADAAQLEVRIGQMDAEVLDVAPDRIVVRVPTLGAFGAMDLQVRTPVGFRTQAGALWYDGAGQPAGFGTSDLPTSVPLAFVAPVQPPGAAGYSDLAVAIGASDSALLVVPAVGAAAATIPLGLVPTSAAARVVPVSGNFQVEVLALGRGGAVALGTAVIDRTALVVNRVQARPLASQVTPGSCTSPQVIFTSSGTAVAAWQNVLGQQKLASIDMAAVAAGQYQAKGGVVLDVPSAILAWAPWQSSSVVFATDTEIYVYDAAAQTDPTPLTFVPGGGLGLPVRVSSRLAAGCSTASLTVGVVTAASHGGSDALAVAYRLGTTDWLALVDVTAGAMSRGIAGTVPTSLALVPDPPFASPTSWAVLAAGISYLYRFRPLAGAPACSDLVADAALPLSSEPGVLPAFGGMIAAADGTRLLATTPEGDLVTVLPPSLTSAGSVFRVASYGGLSMQTATIGGSVVPVAVAEHARFESDLSALDTGSALLVVSLAGDRGSVALGGSGYGRGAVWLDPPGGGALAYTGDLPSTSSLAFDRGGAAAVTGFTDGVCPGEGVRVTVSRPVKNGPDLVAQGPARAGTLGPEGIARFGPAVPPVYAANGTSLAVYVPDPANLACLAGSDPNWDPAQTGTCSPSAVVDLGAEPLDVTLSAGDRAVAFRTLEACMTTCLPNDSLCLRAACPPAKQLTVIEATPGAAAVTVPLPAPPAGVAADRGGGFLVTLRCELSTAAGGDDCFPSSTICDPFLTGPGGEDGALLLVSEDGSHVDCLAVLPALAGPVAVTPNGAQAWVTATAFGAQILSRLALPRRTSDGSIDSTRPAERVAVETLGTAAKATGAFPPGGLGFTPDGATGIVTVPGQFRILLYQ